MIKFGGYSILTTKELSDIKEKAYHKSLTFLKKELKKNKKPNIVIANTLYNSKIDNSLVISYLIISSVLSNCKR